MSNNVLVTGATGSIGKHLVNSLCKKGYNVAVLVRNYEKASSIFSQNQQVTIIDFQEGNWVEKIHAFSVDVVFHLASMLTSRDDFEIIPSLIESNISFGAQLLQALKQTNMSLFINTGSFAEYFFGDGKLNPAYLYSATKTAFHSILKYYQQLVGFQIVNVIPYTVYGQVDTQPKAIDIIYNSFFNQQSLGMSGGEQVLDFIHISDVIEFYCLLINNLSTFKSEWREYHLGTGDGTTLRQIAQIMSEKLNMPENISWGALPYRARDTMYSVAPIAKVINHFGWHPVIDINRGIDEFLLMKKSANISA